MKNLADLAVLAVLAVLADKCPTMDRKDCAFCVCSHFSFTSNIVAVFIPTDYWDYSHKRLASVAKMFQVSIGDQWICLTLYVSA